MNSTSNLFQSTVPFAERTALNTSVRSTAPACDVMPVNPATKRNRSPSATTTEDARPVVAEVMTMLPATKAAVAAAPRSALSSVIRVVNVRAAEP